MARDAAYQRLLAVRVSTALFGLLVLPFGLIAAAVTDKNRPRARNRRRSQSG